MAEPITKAYLEKELDLAMRRLARRFNKVVENLKDRIRKIEEKFAND